MLTHPICKTINHHDHVEPHSPLCSGILGCSLQTYQYSSGGGRGGYYLDVEGVVGQERVVYLTNGIHRQVGSGGGN